MVVVEERLDLLDPIIVVKMKNTRRNDCGVKRCDGDGMERKRNHGNN